MRCPEQIALSTVRLARPQLARPTPITARALPFKEENSARAPFESNRVGSLKTEKSKSTGVLAMIRVLLINPPRTHYSGSVGFDIHFPISLMYLAAMIRDICHVEIFDCMILDFETRKDGEVIHGATPEAIRKAIQEKKPDVVGITVLATAQYRNAELVATIAKEVNPKMITVFGGPDPSVRFNSILENRYCDYVVVGEGEQTFYEFIKRLSSSSSCEDIKGLAYKQGGIVHYEPRPFNTNLDTFPFPAYDLVDMNRYLRSKYLYRGRSEICKNSIAVITSRGCPYHCVFCSIRLHMGQKYRSHSPEYVIKLLRLCMDRYGITSFHFEDDNLTLDKQRFERILDSIIEEKLQIKWDTPNGVRVDSLNYDILKKIKQSGCNKITLAIESGNQRILDEVVHKKLKLEYVMDIVKECKELKIFTDALYVIGFPGEKIDEMEDTANLAIRLYNDFDVDPHLNVATPLYGTELYEICIRDNLIKRDPTFEELCVATQPWGKPMISTPDFSQEDVKRVLNKYTRQLYIQRWRHRLKHIMKLVRQSKD